MSKRSGMLLAEYTIALPVIVFTWGVMIASLVARPRAQATYCMTTLNALNKSALVYCEMNRGFLMPYTHATVPGTELTEAAPSADHTAVCFAAGQVDPTTGLLADARGYGLVYTAGILGPDEMFYCPTQRQKPYVLKDYPKPWGSAVPQGSQFIFNGYMYNPWVKRATAEGKQYVYENGLKLEMHPNERPLVGDITLGQATIAHRRRGQPEWNLGFTDGHVQPFQNQGLAKLFAADPAADWTSWDKWGTLSPDGQAPGENTVYHYLTKVPAGY
jgi:hypothetical protein